MIIGKTSEEMTLEQDAPVRISDKQWKKFFLLRVFTQFLYAKSDDPTLETRPESWKGASHLESLGKWGSERHFQQREQQVCEGSEFEEQKEG